MNSKTWPYISKELIIKLKNNKHGRMKHVPADLHVVIHITEIHVFIKG